MIKNRYITKKGKDSNRKKRRESKITKEKNYYVWKNKTNKLINKKAKPKPKAKDNKNKTKNPKTNKNRPNKMTNSSKTC